MSDVQVKIYNSPTEFERDAAAMVEDGWVVADVSRRASRGALERVRISAFPDRRRADRTGGRGGRVIVTYSAETFDEDDAEGFISADEKRC